MSMSCTIRSEINKPINVKWSAPRSAKTPTATTPPPWDEVSIWTSKPWDEVSCSPLRVSSRSRSLIHLLCLYLMLASSVWRCLHKHKWFRAGCCPVFCRPPATGTAGRTDLPHLKRVICLWCRFQVCGPATKNALEPTDDDLCEISSLNTDALYLEVSRYDSVFKVS